MRKCPHRLTHCGHFRLQRISIRIWSFSATNPNATDPTSCSDHYIDHHNDPPRAIRRASRSDCRQARAGIRPPHSVPARSLPGRAPIQRDSRHSGDPRSTPAAHLVNRAGLRDILGIPADRFWPHGPIGPPEQESPLRKFPIQRALLRRSIFCFSSFCSSLCLFRRMVRQKVSPATVPVPGHG